MIIDENKIIEELQQVGITISNIYDLVNTTKSYSQGLPILIELLRKGIPDDKLKEGVIRSLAVKEAKGLAGATLLEEYNRIPKDKMMLRWAIGSALEVVVTGEELEPVINIVKDRTNGMSRQMFVLALGKLPSEKTEQILIESLDDEEVVAQAIDALSKLKSKKAKTKITELLNHFNPLIRKEALKAIKKIG
jgi:HEAT repeat protein